MRLARWDVVAVAVLLITVGVGCSRATPASPSPAGRAVRSGAKAASAGIPLGPGPQHPYTVQAQPPAGNCHYRRTSDGQPLPDSACTPGALNPGVTQADLAETICRTGGFTRGIRPPVEITDAEKRANARSYGYTRALHDAEYDHLVSLELGGDPNDPRNLWVEPPSPGHAPGAGPENPKDAVEARLHSAVCAGTVTLAAAQRAITTDWATAESALGLSRF